MHPETLIQLADEHVRELQLAADRERISGAVARSSGIPSPRQRLGRRLISFGERLAQSGRPTDELARSRTA